MCDSFQLQSIGYLTLGGGISGAIAVIVFAIWGNKDKWMPEHANNFFGRTYATNVALDQNANWIECMLLLFSGWSFILAAVGVIALIASATCFLTEATVHDKKIRQLKESQARFELERETKA